MAGSLSAFILLLIAAILTALTVCHLLWKNLRELLDELLQLPSGTTFYMRILGIGLVFIALSAALDIQFDLKEGAAFMEYVWKIADGLSATFGFICLFLAGYIVVITILTAALKKRND